jgi:hypothetical protein
MYICIYTYIHIHIYIYIPIDIKNLFTLPCIPFRTPDDDDDDVYLRLQHGIGFHNLVYMSYVKHINPAKRHK